MAGIESSGVSEEPGSRPKRATLLSAKLRDTANAATPELRSHQLPNPNTGGVSSPTNSDTSSPPPILLSTSHKRKRTAADTTINLLDSDNDERAPSRLTKGQ
ncbi:hypothetical protein JVT61DRAFT_7101 [Boletus reticuloceps]|uniref:Uncharacterized protein n=1 Tax=Boletus reticuloceps TaxID=495285 RepID=A0A8I2YIM2_9AGAM|nr:hypothetical protein JVT61DRAFT_7101 [Boletus reticuloceps]